MNTKCFCLTVAAAGVAVLLIWVVKVQRVSPTFLGHPWLTIQAMHSYPINARVRLADSVDTTMRNYFARQGMSRGDAATIERYVVVTDRDGSSKLNLDIRQGAILLHAVDRSFFEPLRLGREASDHQTAHK